MTSFTTSPLRTLRRLLGRTGSSPTRDMGKAVVLDGLNAVAAVEAAMSQTAALAACFPAAIGAQAWARQRQTQPLNLFGHTLGAIDATDPRGALAASMGAAMAGQRATCFLSGPDLLAAQDLLIQIAGQQLPLVVHLACRAPAAHAEAIGSGHEAYHAARDAGWCELFATNLQEAVDLAMIARHFAERAMVPALVACDGEQTAVAMQDVHLPDAGLIRELIGDPAKTIHAASPAQSLLWGQARRRLLRRYDLDRPTMLAARQGPESWALGCASQRAYFSDTAPAMLDDSFDTFASLTGRRYGPLIEHRLDDAQLVLIAQGSAVETLMAVADWARSAHRTKVGVLGIRCLRPLAAKRIAERLRSAKAIAVMERMESPLSGDGPLLTELRAALERFGGRERASKTVRQRLVNVIYGLGGQPLRAADLAALVKAMPTLEQSHVFLGVDFGSRPSDYPKRQALLDRLHRDFPQALRLGLRSDDPPPPIRPQGAITVAVCREAGSDHERLAAHAALLVHESAGGCLRSRPALTAVRSDETCLDIFTCASDSLRDPGDDVPVDIALLADGADPADTNLLDRITPGGALILSAPPEADRVTRLTSECTRALSAKNIEVFVSSPPEASEQEQTDPDTASDTLLGALLKVYLDRANRDDVDAGKARTLFKRTLVEPDADVAERRLQRFTAGFEAVRQVAIEDVAAESVEDGQEDQAPRFVRRLSRADHAPDCLARFWDQTGVLYHDKQMDQLTSDPYAALGLAPSLSASLRRINNHRGALPAFDPTTCDGDSRLWTTCPDGSVVSLVITPKALLEAALAFASDKGRSVDVLRRITSKLARQVAKIVKQDSPPTMAADLLRQAYSAVAPEDESRVELDEALVAVIEQVCDLELVRTDIFFDEPERQKPGSGALFSLMVNPDACKCPELIIERCKGRGLKAVSATSDNLALARRQWKLWQRLPDVSGDSIARVRNHPRAGMLGAMMLSRHCLLAMGNGDGSEPASGACAVLRRVLAAAEFHLQPRCQAHLDQIESLRQKLAERIRQTLSAALPDNDLDALAEGLEGLGRRDLNLEELSGKIDEAVRHTVDGERLGQLVDCARKLAELHFKLSSGVDGLGRARVGLAMSGGSLSACTTVFPYNAFQCPVAIDNCGQIGGFARGLLEGQLEQAMQGLRLMRLGQLMLERPEASADEVENLRYEDLDDEQRALCPPLLVITDERSLGGQDVSQLLDLLTCGRPVKVVLLNEAGGGADGGLNVHAMDAYPAGRRLDSSLLALLSRNAYVAQTSIGFDDHFADAALATMAHDGPALLSVHVPSPKRHGFAPQRLYEQARLAVETRAWPLLTFDPSRGGVFGACLDLCGNPRLEDFWAVGGDGRPLTPAGWAATEARFDHTLTPLEDGAPSPTPVHEWIDLPSDQRQGHTPFVESNRDGERRRWRVGAALLRDIESRLRLWRTLQELAGVVTPFTQKVRDQAEHAVIEAHSAELERLQNEHAAAVADVQAGGRRATAQRLTDRLMSLAGYKTNGSTLKDKAP